MIRVIEKTGWCINNERVQSIFYEFGDEEIEITKVEGGNSTNILRVGGHEEKRYKTMAKMYADNKAIKQYVAHAIMSFEQ